MSAKNKAAITVLLPREDVERRWQLAEHGNDAIGSVTFKDAPGDRGTEIHVEISEEARPGLLGEAVQKVKGDEPVAKVKDTLRRFKAKLETGELPRSEAFPGGESLESKPKGRPAQPLNESELEKVGV
jgi:uncharacterized membrane protein